MRQKITNSDGFRGQLSNLSRREFLKASSRGAVAAGISQVIPLQAGAHAAAPGGGEGKPWNGEPGVFHRTHGPRGPMVYRDDGSIILFQSCDDGVKYTSTVDRAFVS